MPTELEKRHRNESTSKYFPKVNATIKSADDLDYFSEGRSNVLYRYIGKKDELTPHLFRLRKQLPNSPTTLNQQSYQIQTFSPLLSSYMIQTELAQIQPGVISELNKRQIKAGRGTDALLDESEIYAIMVEDMSPGVYQRYRRISQKMRQEYPFLVPPPADSEPPTPAQTRPGTPEPYQFPSERDADPSLLSERNWRDIMMFEFKPEYLAQSADAPHDWKLCHNCAERAMQSHTRSRTASDDSGISVSDSSSENEDPETPEYCPLDIVSSSIKRVHRASEALLNKHANVTILNEEEVVVSDPALGVHGISPWLDALERSIVNILANYFADEGSVVKVLAKCQRDFAGDVKLVHASTPSDFDINRLLSGGAPLPAIEMSTLQKVANAMTLRECSVYLRLWLREKKENSGLEVHMECKVGGLDIQAAVAAEDGEKGLFEHWRNQERKLIAGKWYMHDKQDGSICR